MKIFEVVKRIGKSTIAVIGWGRGMGHKGHMYLADAVFTHAKLLKADPYFMLSRSSIIDSSGQINFKHKDDPLTPDEKLKIYKKVFPQYSDNFQVTTPEMPTLTHILTSLDKKGYNEVVVVVGSDQKDKLNYVEKYNKTADKSGNIPYNFDSLKVISREETTSQYANMPGPRASDMRNAIMDSGLTDDEKFKIWRRDMPKELSDQEIKEIMNKVAKRLGAVLTGKSSKIRPNDNDYPPAPKPKEKPKK